MSKTFEQWEQEYPFELLALQYKDYRAYAYAVAEVAWYASRTETMKEFGIEVEE